MATNPAGKGTKTIGINMKKGMAEDLEKRAASMSLSTGAYCKIVLGEWLNSGKKLKLLEDGKTKVNVYTGKGTKTVGINMKLEIALDLEGRAKSMHLSTGMYCKIILGQWLASGKKLKLQES